MTCSAVISMRKMRYVGDQKRGDDLLRGEESHNTFSLSQFVTFIIISATIFSMANTKKSKDKTCKEGITKLIKEWDLKLIQGKISEEEYLSRLKELSSKQD